MNLYYAPGACSLSPHIVAREAGLDIDLCKVDLKSHQLESGADFTEINPKGYVPTLQLEGGEVLTEGPTIVQFMAEQKLDAGLLPESGSLDRYRVQEWLNFISSELHKAFAPLFSGASDEEKQKAKEQIRKRFDYVESQLDGKYLVGDRFTVADAYLFTIANWLDQHNIDTSLWPKLQAYQKRVAERPAVRETLREEGLLEEQTKE
ncbi:glutathione transferase GstA [Microbulbifer sp.]|uniref:glutathione transferase GstA n=1 Tax=Microbulbifer sp. TaxID=1908541 RepID=UPI003F2A6C8A